MSEIKKIYLTIVLVLALAFSLVIISSATPLIYTTDATGLEDVAQEGDTHGDNYVGLLGSGYAYYVTYGNVPNGNFVIDIIGVEGSGFYSTSYIFFLSDYEAFQTRYNGYTIGEIYSEWVDNELYNLTGVYSEVIEYFLNYQPVDTSTMVEWSDVNSTIHEWYVNDFSGTIYENVNVESISTLNAFLNDNATYTKDLLVDDLNSKNNTIDSLHSEIDNLTVEIENVRSEGYAQGMADADAVERGALTIISAPLYIITSIFNVDIFGINLLTLLTTIMTIVVVAWVIKKLAN